ncbi:MAG: hypothetical protein AAGB05_05460 [Pseudomonadota bacterium]
MREQQVLRPVAQGKSELSDAADPRDGAPARAAPGSAGVVGVGSIAPRLHIREIVEAP